MSDYTPTTNFTAKDSLPTGNAAKVVSGVEIDLEYANIQTAIATKVDAVGSGLSLTSKTISYDIAGLTNVTPATADEFVISDASDSNNPKALTVTALADFYVGTASASGLRNNSGVITLDLDSLTNVTPAATDEFVVADASDSGNPKAVLFSAVEAALNHDSLTGFVADEHIAHSGVTLTAGNGLTGGGTIAASRSFAVGAGDGISVAADSVALDISGLTSMTATPTGTDSFLYNDGGTMKQMTFEQVALPANSVSSSRAFASSDCGHIVRVTSGTVTLTMNSATGQNNTWIVVVNSTTNDVTLASGTATIDSANSLLTIPAGGMATLIRESSTLWHAGGSLQ